MIRGIYLSALVWGAVIILFVMLLLDGASVTTGLFKPCGAVVGELGFFRSGSDERART